MTDRDREITREAVWQHRYADTQLLEEWAANNVEWIADTLGKMFSAGSPEAMSAGMSLLRNDYDDHVQACIQTPEWVGQRTEDRLAAEQDDNLYVLYEKY